MITYKDMTFCPFTDCTKDCFRKLNETIWEKARAIGLPISQFVEKPDCFEVEDVKIKRLPKMPG